MSVTDTVVGARARLGSLVCEVVEAHHAAKLGAQLSSSSDPEAGAEDAILVDVSHSEAPQAIVERAVRRGQRVVVGTSG